MLGWVPAADAAIAARCDVCWPIADHEVYCGICAAAALQVATLLPSWGWSVAQEARAKSQLAWNRLNASPSWQLVDLTRWG